MLKAYSYPFPTLGTHMKSQAEILFKGGELLHPRCYTLNHLLKHVMSIMFMC